MPWVLPGLVHAKARRTVRSLPPGAIPPDTIVLVTHEQDIAMHAHRIIHVRDGKVEKEEQIK